MSENHALYRPCPHVTPTDSTIPAFLSTRFTSWEFIGNVDKCALRVRLGPVGAHFSLYCNRVLLGEDADRRTGLEEMGQDS